MNKHLARTNGYASPPDSLAARARPYRGVMHAVEGAWPVSVESQWLDVFVAAGRPLNTPPQGALFHRRSRNRFCAETVNKTADWPRSRIVQQTDWPRCIRIDMQEWPPCHGVTHGVALLRRFWLIRPMGGKYTCKFQARQARRAMSRTLFPPSTR